MKVTFEVGRDEELRKELLELIRSEVRSITGQEIRDIAKEYMAELNVAGKVSSVFKELVNSHLDDMARSYGRLLVNDIIEARFKEVVDIRFEAFFKERCIPFLQEYLGPNLNTVSKTLTGLRDLLSRGKNG
jgi:hypothetical protein